jgi:glycosyltransferase involved in cell wall biosynthesis
MKILHIINYYHEGFGYQENCLSSSQRDLGCDVRIVTSDYYAQFPNYDDTIKHVLGERKKGDGIYQDNGITVIRKKSMFSKCRPGFIIFSVANVLYDFHPDVVHVHGATNIWMLQLIYYKSKLGFKVFIDSHQDYSVESYSGGVVDRAYYYFWSLYHRWLIKSCSISKYLPITKQSSEWLEKRLGVSVDMQELSPLGVDQSIMNYSPDDEIRLREEWGARNKLVIVNAGKQYEEKGIHWIIDIVVMLSMSGVDVFLVLVGVADEVYDKKIDKKLTNLSKDSWLRLPFQEREELRKIYSASDIGIWPGIPSITIQEAMACGVALLLPDDGIVGHLIDGNGIHISESDELTVNSLCELASSKDLLDQMKKTSIEMADKYSWKRIASDTIELYES